MKLDAALTRRNTKIAALRSRGLTLAEIGARYGLSKERIRQVLNGGGTPAPVPNTARNAAIIARRRAGATLIEIGNEFEISSSRAAVICKPVSNAAAWQARKAEVRGGMIRHDLRRAAKVIERARLLAAGTELEADLADLLEACRATLDLIKEDD